MITNMKDFLYFNFLTITGKSYCRVATAVQWKSGRKSNINNEAPVACTINM